MGDKITLDLVVRDAHGKKVAKLRKEGLTPAIVYGPGVDPISVQADEQVVKKVVKNAGKHTPVHLTIEGKKKIAMIKDVDIDPAKNSIRHVSFHAVRQNQPVEAEVPIRLVGEGESEAERAGLIVLQTLDKVEVKALPMNLPEALEADIRGLKEAGEKLLLSDVSLPEGVEIVEHDTGHHDEDEESPSILDQVVASVWEPSALQAANDAAAGDAEDESEVESENGEAEGASSDADQGESDKKSE